MVFHFDINHYFAARSDRAAVLISNSAQQESPDNYNGTRSRRLGSLITPPSAYQWLSRECLTIQCGSSSFDNHDVQLADIKDTRRRVATRSKCVARNTPKRVGTPLFGYNKGRRTKMWLDGEKWGTVCFSQPRIWAERDSVVSFPFELEQGLRQVTFS